jgi:pimeloyl-CoA synthetase
MEMVYMGKVDVAADPKIGSFYAVKVDDCWHRVELVEMNDTHTGGRVFFIDHGDEEDVDFNELHLLEERFARLPAQVCRYSSPDLYKYLN